MRPVALSVLLLLAGCATNAPQPPSGEVFIETASNGQPVAGAQCIASTAAGRWNVTPPVTVAVGVAAGDLRVLCSKPGYRTSEVVYRPSPYATSGTGYPNVGIGVGGGSGNVGVGVGMNFPIGGGARVPAHSYPQRIVVEMTPQ